MVYITSSGVRHGAYYFEQSISKCDLFWTVTLHGINWFEHSSDKLNLFITALNFKLQASVYCNLVSITVQNNLAHPV